MQHWTVLSRSTNPGFRSCPKFKCTNCKKLVKTRYLIAANYNYTPDEYIRAGGDLCANELLRTGRNRVCKSCMNQKNAYIDKTVIVYLKYRAWTYEWIYGEINARIHYQLEYNLIKSQGYDPESYHDKDWYDEEDDYKHDPDDEDEDRPWSDIGIIRKKLPNRKL